MILTPTPRLHSQFQHPIDPGHNQFFAPFPEFALFTTLLGRVRLSQSGQWLADAAIITLLAINRQSHSLFERWSLSLPKGGQKRSSCGAVTGTGLLTAAPLIPTWSLSLPQGSPEYR